MSPCPKCGGEVREGEALVRFTTPTQAAAGGFGGMTVPGVELPVGETTTVERINWRERTGRKTGKLFKSEEVLLLRISGRRCVSCGYLELYAKE